MISQEEKEVRELQGKRVIETLTEIGKVWRNNKENLQYARSYNISALHKSLQEALKAMNKTFNL